MRSKILWKCGNLLMTTIDNIFITILIENKYNDNTYCIFTICYASCFNFFIYHYNSAIGLGSNPGLGRSMKEVSSPLHGQRSLVDYNPIESKKNQTQLSDKTATIT